LAALILAAACEKPAIPCSVAQLDSLTAAGNSGLAMEYFYLPASEPAPVGGSGANVWFAGQDTRLIRSRSKLPDRLVDESYFIIDSLNFAFVSNGPGSETVHVCGGRALDAAPERAREHLTIIAGRLRSLDTLFPRMTAEQASHLHDTSLAARFDTLHRAVNAKYGKVPDVFVVIGQSRFSLSTDLRFADSAARMLPKPGILPNNDAHADMHGDKTLCFAFSGGYFTLDDGDWGLTGIDVFRGATPTKARCATVTEAPVVEVAGRRLSLDTPESGFSTVAFPNLEVAKQEPGLRGEWWNFKRGEGGQLHCWFDDLFISYKISEARVASFSVTKTGEGGSVRPTARSLTARDTIYTCG
jgi:hypothetical protein